MSFRVWIMSLLTGSKLKALVAEGDRLNKGKAHLEALDVFRDVSHRWPNHPAGYNGMADAYQGLGLRMEAMREGEIADALLRLARSPGDHDARISLAKNLMEKEMYGRAAAQMEQLVKTAPHTKDLLRLAALVYAANRNFQKAVEPLQRLLRTDPLNPGLYEQLSNALRGAGRSSEAKRAADMAKNLRGVAANPGDPGVVGETVRMFMAKSQYKMAMAIADQAVRAAPHEAELYCLMGSIQIENRDGENAVKTLARAVQLDPANNKSHRLLAKSYAMMGDEDRARQHLGMAKSLETAKVTADNAQSDLVRARVLLQNGQLDQARQIAGSLAQSYPNDWRTSFVGGMVKKQEGELKRALTFFVDALKKNDNSPELHVEMGSVFSQLGDTSRAVSSMRKAVHLAPRDLEIRLIMAETLRAHGLIEAAVQEEELAESLRQSLASDKRR